MTDATELTDEPSHWVWVAPDGEHTLISVNEPETPAIKLQLLNLWHTRKVQPINIARNIAEFEIRTGTRVVPAEEPA